MDSLAVHRNWRRLKRRDTNGGFSFVEVLIVLAILTVLSSVALFTYGSYRRTLSVRNSAQVINTLFATARMMAINSNLPISSSIDLDRQMFWLDEMNAAGSSVSRPKIAGVASPADFVIMDGVRLATGEQRTGLVRVLFWPDGRGTYAVVYLRRQMDNPSNPEAYYSIRVFPSTGVAQILPNERR